MLLAGGVLAGKHLLRCSYLTSQGMNPQKPIAHYKMRPVHDSSVSVTGLGEGVSGGTRLFLADGGSR